ncbi:hypothetical protein EV13_0110 [Prochlorococcus sp. MIT 0702]|nr:hypothetical protein EV13_0110 [Prochlorococcus sp. MIT 0702]
MSRLTRRDTGTLPRVSRNWTASSPALERELSQFSAIENVRLNQ